MPTKITTAGEIDTSAHFPYAGLDVSRAFCRQPVRPIGQEQKYSRTTAFGMNVRSYDGQQGRLRGGSRTGISRYVNDRVSGSNLIQGMNLITGTGYTAPGGNVQTSQSGRLVTLVAVSDGDVKILNPGDTSWTSVTNGTNALNTTGVIYSAPNAGRLYFADGVNMKYYDPSTNSVGTWTATAGTLPIDSSGNRPRNIATWRGRTVMWGLLGEPQNWFMSRVDTPTDFDYFPATVTPVQAVAGNNSTLGLIGDVITTGIPFTDDVFVWGGDHSISMMLGDPMDGGRINMISDTIGMAWGKPWCRGPNGEIYFFSNLCGIYVMTPGQPLVRISQPIENLLKTVNTGANTITMSWDDRWQGFHVFVTRTALAYRAVHLFYELRAGAWWMDSFENKNHNPLVTCTFDGNLPQDRVALIGSWDGYVRYLNPDATDDDGYDIASSVVIGPFLTKDLDDVKAKDIQALMGETSGNVDFEILVDSSAERALDAAARVQGQWKAGRNLSDFIRAAGHAIYIKISSTDPWAMESFRMRLVSMGKVRRRGA